MAGLRKVIGDDQEHYEEFTPPQMFAREQLEWMDFQDTGIKSEGLPRPTTWHVLVFPKQPKKMSAGGIVLPSQVQDVEAHLNYIGQVVAMGPLAGRNEKFQNPEWSRDPFSEVPRYLWEVKVGDWVTYGRYSGQSTEYKGTLLLMVNDDDIVSVIDSPAGFRILV